MFAESITVKPIILIFFVGINCDLSNVKNQ